MWGKWHHKWTWVPSPDAMERHTPGRPSAYHAESDSAARELQNRLDAVTGQVKRLQAAQDKQEYQGRRSNYDNRSGHDGRDSKAKGGKGGRDSKAKGRGGSFQQAQFGGKQGGGGGNVTSGGAARQKRNRGR